MRPCRAHAAEALIRPHHAEAAPYVVRPVSAPLRSPTPAEIDLVIDAVRGTAGVVLPKDYQELVDRVVPGVAVTYSVRIAIDIVIAEAREFHQAA